VIRKHIVPIVIELVGIATTVAGIGLELAVGGNLYLAMITTGSCLIAIGGIIWGKLIKKGEG